MKNLKDTKVYKDIVKNKTQCIFISPHLDDAIFSAGGLINDLAKKHIRVTVVNVFTRPSPAPYTISVKKFLRACGENNADSLYQKRVAEDRHALKKAGAKVVNLGFVDALWRRKKMGKFAKIISQYIPEVSYVYPMFRTSIAIGKISKEDIKLQANIENKLKELKIGNAAIFSPIAVGKHVDHLIVRNACNKIFNNLIYWTDYPYIKNRSADKNFIKENSLGLHKLKIVTNKKEALVNMYKSQIKAIFGTDHESIANEERYYYKKS